MTGQAPRIGWALRRILWPSAALLVLVLGIATQINRPALYFDEVFVDYLVVPLVNPHAVEFPVRLWIPPGNYLFDRFPLLIQLYHGALPLYFGLPLYAAFGTGVVAVRIVHGTFAAVILALLWSLLRRADVPAWIAGLAAIALALDPAFLFAFRTQYYILLVPLIPFLLSVALAERARGATAPRSRRLMLAGSGLLAGLACYGYFVYFALVPAVAWLALRRDGVGNERVPSRSAWVGGYALGIAPYLLGLLLIAVAQGGFDAAQTWMRAYFAGLNSGMQYGGLLERVPQFFLQMNRMLTAEALTLDVFGVRTIAADGLASLPGGAPVGQTGAGLKLAALLSLAIAAGAFATRDHASSRTVRLVLIGFAGMFVLALVFGRRLLPHHFVPAVPLLYALSAVGAAMLCRQATQRSAGSHGSAPSAWTRGVAVAVASTLALIGAINAIDREAVFDRLAADEATWMFHSSVSRFAEAARADPGPTYYFFPDWGLFTSFAMITRGTIPFWTEFVPARARSNLCAGRDVVFVSTRPGEDPRIAQWTEQIGWTAPRREEYAQNDGTRIFVAVRWLAQQGPSERQPCPH